MKTKTWTAVAASLAAPVAMAHSLWIEPDGAGAPRALYGEPEIRLQECSPGKLDGLVFTASKQGTTAWSKSATGFALPDAKTDAESWIEARATAVLAGTSTSGGTQALYHARRMVWPLKATPSAMALDIVPAAQANTFAVTFNGTPLKSGTLKVIAPSLWLQVHDIDERGLVRIHTPWRGLYVLEVDHPEQRPGELNGVRYDTVAHRATLSFTKPDGLVFDNPLPAQYKVD